MLGETQHAACGSLHLVWQEASHCSCQVVWTTSLLRPEKKEEGRRKEVRKETEKIRYNGKSREASRPSLSSLYHTTQMLCPTICSFKFKFLRLDLEKLGMTAGRSTANYPRPVFQVARLRVHVCSSDTDVVTFRGCWRLASY